MSSLANQDAATWLDPAQFYLFPPELSDGQPQCPNSFKDLTMVAGSQKVNICVL
jgi:hypothetical protein